MYVSHLILYLRCKFHDNIPNDRQDIADLLLGYFNLGHPVYTENSSAVAAPTRDKEALAPVKLLSAAGSKKVFCYFQEQNGKLCVTKKTFRNHNNLNCDRIFSAKRQLFLIPLNRTAALPAALSNLTRPWSQGRRQNFWLGTPTFSAFFHSSHPPFPPPAKSSYGVWSAVEMRRLGLFDGHVAGLSGSTAANQILRTCCLAEDWRRPHGRRHSTWIDQICQDTGVTTAEALELVEDRRFWQTIEMLEGSG